jgi:hypothetical protein
VVRVLNTALEGEVIRVGGAVAERSAWSILAWSEERVVGEVGDYLETLV